MPYPPPLNAIHVLLLYFQDNCCPDLLLLSSISFDIYLPASSALLVSRQSFSPLSVASSRTRPIQELRVGLGRPQNDQVSLPITNASTATIASVFLPFHDILLRPPLLPPHPAPAQDTLPPVPVHQPFAICLPMFGEYGVQILEWSFKVSNNLSRYIRFRAWSSSWHTRWAW